MQEKIIISENKFSYNNPLSSKQHIPENEQKAYEEHTKQRIIFYSSLAMNESKEQLNNLVNEHHCAILIENQMKQIFLYQANHSIVDVSNCFIKQDVCFSWFSKLKQKGKDSWLLCEDERTIQSIAASLENREAVLYSYAQELANPLSLYPETLMSLSSLSKQGLNLFAQKRKKVLSQTLAMHKYTESAQSLLQYLQAINESGDIKLIEYVKNFFIKFDANFIEYLCHPETAPHHIMSLVNLLSLDLVLPPKLTSDLYIIPVREINSYFIDYGQLYYRGPYSRTPTLIRDKYNHYMFWGYKKQAWKFFSIDYNHKEKLDQYYSKIYGPLFDDKRRIERVTHGNDTSNILNTLGHTRDFSAELDNHFPAAGYIQSVLGLGNDILSQGSLLLDRFWRQPLDAIIFLYTELKKRLGKDVFYQSLFMSLVEIFNKQCLLDNTSSIFIYDWKTEDNKLLDKIALFLCDECISHEQRLIALKKLYILHDKNDFLFTSRQFSSIFHKIFTFVGRPEFVEHISKSETLFVDLQAFYNKMIYHKAEPMLFLQLNNFLINLITNGLKLKEYEQHMSHIERSNASFDAKQISHRYAAMHPIVHAFMMVSCSLFHAAEQINIHEDKLKKAMFFSAISLNNNLKNLHTEEQWLLKVLSFFSHPETLELLDIPKIVLEGSYHMVFEEFFKLKNMIQSLWNESNLDQSTWRLSEVSKK